MESKGDSAEELHSVGRLKRICEVLCSSPVSGLWVRSTGCTSAEFLWRVILEIIGSVLFSLLMVLIVLSVVSINAVICETEGLAVTIFCGPYKCHFWFLAVVLPVYHSYWLWLCSTSFILPWIWLSEPYSLWKWRWRQQVCQKHQYCTVLVVLR